MQRRVFNGRYNVILKGLPQGCKLDAFRDEIRVEYFKSPSFSDILYGRLK